MKYLMTIGLIMMGGMLNKVTPIFDFEKGGDLSNWMIVDDVVMGGRSDGNLYINKAGHGIFEGLVSLENNGGFSSARCQFLPQSIKGYTHFVIRVKGDKRRYQFRAKSSPYDRHAYIYYFKTTGKWQTIKIPIKEMYPSFRGMQLNMPNYSGETLGEMAFLIANKKAEAFKLEIDWIGLE